MDGSSNWTPRDTVLGDDMARGDRPTPARREDVQHGLDVARAPFHNGRPMPSSSPRRRSTLVRAAAALGVVALASAPLACGRIPRQVHRSDCEAWSGHFIELTKQSYASIRARCWSGNGLKIAQTDDPKKKLLLQADPDAVSKLDKERDSIVEQCASQDGAKYYPPDAECLMRAQKLGDVRSCKFKTPFFASLADVVTALDKQVNDVCGAGVD
jgi:hypothetical protein